MNTPKKQYSPEVKGRAIESIAPKMGCAAATLREWVNCHQIDNGQRDGVTTSERERIKKLAQENKELRRANEILKLASAFFSYGIT